MDLSGELKAGKFRAMTQLDTGPHTSAPLQPQGSRTLVTGAGGFIGGHVARSLCRSGAPPRVMLRSRRAKILKDHPEIEFRSGTLRSPGDALSGVQTVLNFAYDIREGGARNLRDFNVFLDAMISAGIKTLVHASSIVVHDGWPHDKIDETSSITRPNEDNSYRAAKIAIEDLIREAVRHGRIQRAVILRLSLVYGPGGWMWTKRTVERLRGGPILLPERPVGLSADLKFGLCHILHVDDLAHAAIQASQLPTDGIRHYIVSDPEPPTWETYYLAHSEIVGTGSVKKVPYEKLSARIPQPRKRPAAQGVPISTRASALVRRLIGSATTDSITNIFQYFSPTHKGDQVPDRWLLDLYSSTSRLDISRAVNELGFHPRKTFPERLTEMSADLKRY